MKTRWRLLSPSRALTYVAFQVIGNIQYGCMASLSPGPISSWSPSLPLLVLHYLLKKHYDLHYKKNVHRSNALLSPTIRYTLLCSSMVHMEPLLSPTIIRVYLWFISTPFFLDHLFCNEHSYTLTKLNLPCVWHVIYGIAITKYRVGHCGRRRGSCMCTVLRKLAHRRIVAFKSLSLADILVLIEPTPH